MPSIDGAFAASKALYAADAQANGGMIGGSGSGGDIRTWDDGPAKAAALFALDARDKANGASPSGAYQSDAAGFTEWTIDPALCSTSWQINNGVLILVRCHFHRDATLDEIGCVVFAAGSSPGAYTGVGVYTDGQATITKAGESADAGTTLTSTGVKSIPLTAPVTIGAGTYRWIGILWQGSTGPRISGSNAAIDEVTMNVGARRCVYLTGQTAMPASIDISTANLNNANYLLTMKDN